MHRRRRLNGALAAVVLVLGGIAWFLESRDTDSVTPLLTNLDRARVKAIEIGRPGHAKIALERREAGWYVAAPHDLPANAVWVGRILDLLTVKSVKRLDSPAPDRRGFGLAPPRMSIGFDATLIHIGDRHPYNLQRYLEFNGELHLVEDRFTRVMGAPAAALVSPRLIPAGDEISFIETPGWRLFRDERHDWRVEPANETPSGDRLTAKAAAWRSAEAIELSEPEGAMEGAPVRIGLEGGTTILEFLIFGRGDARLLASPETGLAYELPRLDRLLAHPQLPLEP